MKISISFKFLACFSVLLSITSHHLPFTGFAESWKDVRGDHFIVYYRESEPFARKTLYHAEKYYTRIADELGYARHSNFWQWENRAKIYVYPDAKSFREATGEAGWSHGLAIYSKREIHSFIGEEGFEETILPHEIAHLIFRDFVGTDGRIPVWLDEGVAQWQEPKKREIARKVARWLLHTDKDLPLQDLFATDPRRLEDEEKVMHFYMQSVCLVDWLVRTYGPGAFTIFCRALRDGKPFNTALREAYRIETIADLDYKWRQDLFKEPVSGLEYYS